VARQCLAGTEPIREVQRQDRLDDADDRRTEQHDCHCRGGAGRPQHGEHPGGIVDGWALCLGEQHRERQPGHPYHGSQHERDDEAELLGQNEPSPVQWRACSPGSGCCWGSFWR